MVRQRINRDSGSVVLVAKRSNYVILALFVAAVYGSWFVYEQQYLNLPTPLGAQHVGKRGFSEHEAIQHVIALTQFGPHPVGSPALNHALQYVLQAAENIKETAHWEVDVELDLFHAKSGANHMVGGLFKGKTLVYSDLNHIILRISPKYAPEATENAILVSSHIDTVFSAYVSLFHTVVFKIYLYFYLPVIIDTSVCYKCCSESRILLMLSLFFS